MNLLLLSQLSTSVDVSNHNTEINVQNESRHDACYIEIFCFVSIKCIYYGHKNSFRLITLEYVIHSGY